MTIFSRVTFPTLAGVVFDLVDTSGVVFTRIDLAVVDVDLAVFTLEAGVVTITAVRVDTVQTLTLIQTGLGRAVIDVYFAARAGETRQTVAGVSESI